MSAVYDNWDRLIRAVFRREELLEIALRTPSNLSSAASSSSTSASTPFHLGLCHGQVSSLSSWRLLVGESFSYFQILQATNSFSDWNLIKRGHSGDLYLGVLHNGIKVVVKRIDLSSLEKELCLMSEMEILGKVNNHSRVVPLLGHCLEKAEEKFLVYKYMCNEDLSSYLNSKIYMDWRTRLKIATEVAQGLCYLHHDCSPPIVHRDVQASSILLDDDLQVFLASLSGAGIEEGNNNPKRSFRFLHLSMRSRSSQQRNSGTRNEATFSCDVYNFGKVLLELITGRLVGTSAADDSTMKDSIVNTLRYIVSDDKALIANIVDPYLVIHDDILEEVLAVAYIAKACLNSKPSKRPKMTKVLKILEDQKVKAEARGMRPRIEEGRLETKLVFSSGESQFRFIELLRSPAELLGRGNFGSCYKVILKNGPTVVVRRLKPLKPLSIDESREQVGIIADQEHPNLMPLIAHFCFKNEKLLIYKFASKGNAYNRLHARKGNPSRIPFSWSSRLSVARGVARALQHLHINTMSSNVAPHGNLKLSNVLLDENGDVLVTDYGLTTLVAAPTVAKHMVAYKSPEYRSSRTESKKSDVWSYGYLLLELVTGRASTISAEAGPDAVDLFRWVRQSFRNGWNDEIFDEEIRVHGRATYEMVKLLEIGMKCCANSPENRPGMDEVVREVESIKEVNTTWIRTSKDYFNPRT